MDVTKFGEGDGFSLASSFILHKQPIIMNIQPIQIIDTSSLVNDVVLQDILNNSYGSTGNELDKTTIHVNTPKTTQPSLG